MQLIFKLLRPVFSPCYGVADVFWSNTKVTTNRSSTTKTYFLLIVLLITVYYLAMLMYVARVLWIVVEFICY